MLLRPVDLDATLPPDHEARVMWRMVQGLDLSEFLKPLRAREGEPGQSAIDPAILLALWLYATSQGVGSARELDRLCKEHDAYRWICGGVSVNYHTLSDFRVDHGEALDELFTQVLGKMMELGLVTLTRVAQDGTRVRASAGAGSFHRKATLEQLLAEAKEQVEHLKQLVEDPSVTSREAAAQKRAAVDKERRVKQALEELPAIRKVKKKEKDEARASTTDPEARVMKMADGGFRPGYNIQAAATTTEKVIVGVDATNVGSDGAQMEPMLAQIERRTGERPEEYLVDGGFVNLQAIDQAASQGVTVYAPVPESRTEGVDRYAAKREDTPHVVAWRERMATEEAKAIYKDRAETSELVNAQFKEHQGLKLRVRGLKKVLTMGLWMALTYNLLRWVALTAN